MHLLKPQKASMFFLQRNGLRKEMACVNVNHYLNKGIITSLIKIMISAMMNIISEMRFMPCIYFIHFVLGALGSRFFMYKYSAICCQMPIEIMFRQN